MKTLKPRVVAVDDTGLGNTFKICVLTTFLVFFSIGTLANYYERDTFMVFVLPIGIISVFSMILFVMIRRPFLRYCRNIFSSAREAYRFNHLAPISYDDIWKADAGNILEELLKWKR